jgi:hypothetical protein
MLEEMLNSRSASAAERVSIDAGAWEALGESAMLANVMRPVATSTSEQLIMPEDDDDDEDPAHLDPHDLRMQRPGTDWEELSLAGINPRARKNRRDSAADRSPKVAGPYKPPHVKRETSDNLIAQHATRHKRESVSSGDVLVKTAPRRVKIITPPAVAVTPSKPRPHQPLVSATEASNLRALEAADAGQADMEGAIADISILRIIHRLLLGKCSGRLRLSGEDATRDIYLRDGRVVAIDSTVPEDQLGRILVAQGLVTNEQLNFALDRAQTTRKLLGAVVVAERLCAPHELFHTLQEQLRVKLTRSLFWQNVIWEWWADDAFVVDTFPLAVDEGDTIARAVLDGPRTGYFRDFYSERLDTPLKRNVEQIDAREYHLSAKAMRLMSFVDGESTIASLVHTFADCYRWRHKEVYQTLYLLTEFEVFGFVGERTKRLPG